MNCDLAIEALRKGREKFPIKISGEPFGNIPGSACAIGAIAVGLGYDHLDYDNENDDDTNVYSFVKTKLNIAKGEGPALSAIYFTNDNCFDWNEEGTEQHMICDPDEAVINRIREECK